MSPRSDDSIRADIIKLLENNRHRTFRAKEIAKRLGYTDNVTYRRFRQMLADMDEQGAVMRAKRGQFTVSRSPARVEGILRVNPQGFGFLEVKDREEDLFIRESNMGNALDGDRVLAGLSAPGRGDRRREAEVLEVVERKRTRVVGTFVQKGHFAFVVPDDKRITQDVYVPDDAFNGATDGVKVMVSIDRFDDRRASPEGRVLEVIGDASDPRV